MTRRVDFSRQAKAYDCRHGAFVPDAVVRELMQVSQIAPGARLLEVGAGTGRAAVPFAKAGCRVTGLDVSRAMLDGLLQKGAGWVVHAIVGEGSRLPFPSSLFDGVVMARLLYLLPDWQAVMSEVVRVLRPRGVLFHEWGNGTSDEEWVNIREKARSLFEGAGVNDPFHPGVRSETEVEQALRARNLHEIGNVSTPGDVHMTLGEFLRRIVDGECSYTWDVPKGVLGPCLTELNEWTRKRFPLDRPMAIPREVSWTIFKSG